MAKNPLAGGFEEQVITTKLSELVNWCRSDRFGKAPLTCARCMRPPGVARDWMREQEVAAGPVRTLSKGSAACRHWPFELVRTVLLATSAACANRAPGDRGIERVPQGCRCVHRVRAPRATLPARAQPSWT